jgi:SPX domain protein involved in polyphosphate accumulation
MDLKQAREVLAKWDRRDLDGDYTSKIEALRAALAEVDRLEQKLKDGWIRVNQTGMGKIVEENDKLRAECDQLTAERKQLENAAEALLNACYLADSMEELGGAVDGTLLDAVSNALGHP